MGWDGSDKCVPWTTLSNGASFMYGWFNYVTMGQSQFQSWVCSHHCGAVSISWEICSWFDRHIVRGISHKSLHGCLDLRCHAFPLDGQVSAECSKCPGSMERRARDCVAPLGRRLDACEDRKIVRWCRAQASSHNSQGVVDGMSMRPV